MVLALNSVTAVICFWYMSLIISFIANMISVGISAYLLPGVNVTSLSALFWTVLVMSIVNTLIKPILIIITLPINVLTLGLFSLIINAILILIVDYFVAGFSVDGLLWALLFSVVMSIVSSLVNTVVKS